MANSSAWPLFSPDINMTTANRNTSATISTLHPDIMESHILTRLDGPTLASFSCATLHFHALASEENLWTNICHSTWPSTTSPRVRHVISDFPKGHRSFFSDAFPLLATEPAAASFENSLENNLNLPSELISAVDIYYKKDLIFSKVVETETESSWFKCSPFRVDLLDLKEALSTRIPYPNSDDTFRELEEDMELSWIVIDPIGKRAMNLSSQRPVTVNRHRLSGDVQVKFAEVVGGGGSGTATELALCGVVVTCGRSARGEMMHLTEVSLQVEDMEGMFLNGKDSLVILKRGLEGKRGKGKKREEERKKEFVEFLERKRGRKEKKLREGIWIFFALRLVVLAFASIGLFYFFS